MSDKRDRRIWFHWQNLTDEDERGEARGFPWHGRCWLHVGRATLGFEWSARLLPTAWTGITLSKTHDRVSAGFSAPLLSVYPSVEHPRIGRLEDKDIIGITAHGGCVWWKCWADPWGWSSRTPKWQQRTFRVVDWLLGSTEHTKREIRRETVPIPLPEGTVRAEVVLSESTWTRKRWPFPERMRRAEVKPEVPTPVPGKGENSYDCGPDAVYSSSFPANSVTEAIGKYVGDVLTERRKRGAPLDYSERSYGPPEAESEDVAMAAEGSS